jgi:hypothetical protein
MPTIATVLQNLTGVLTEAAFELGTPLKAVLLFSDGGRMLVDVNTVPVEDTYDTELKISDVKEFPSDNGAEYTFPVSVSMHAPLGMRSGWLSDPESEEGFDEVDSVVAMQARP